MKRTHSRVGNIVYNTLRLTLVLHQLPGLQLPQPCTEVDIAWPKGINF